VKKIKKHINPSKYSLLIGSLATNLFLNRMSIEDKMIQVDTTTWIFGLYQPLLFAAGTMLIFLLALGSAVTSWFPFLKHATFPLVVWFLTDMILLTVVGLPLDECRILHGKSPSLHLQAKLKLAATFVCVYLVMVGTTLFSAFWHVLANQPASIAYILATPFMPMMFVTYFATNVWIIYHDAATGLLFWTGILTYTVPVVEPPAIPVKYVKPRLAD